MTKLKTLLDEANKAPLLNKPEREQINNKEAVGQFRATGGRILHFRPSFVRSRGFSVAFVHKGGRITFSTALQHRADDFTKKMGTKTALEHFLEGKTVTLPLGNAECPINALRNLMYSFR